MTVHIDARRSGKVNLYALLDGDDVLIKSVSRSYIRAAKRWTCFNETGIDRALLIRHKAILGADTASEGLLLDCGDVWWRNDHLVDA